MWYHLLLLWVYTLQLFFYLQGTTLVQGDQTTELTTDRLSKTPGESDLWTLVKELQDKVDKLQNEGDSQRSFTKELERRVIENQDEILISMADIVQLKQAVAEMQIRLTRMEEMLDEQKLQFIQYNFEQNQLKSELLPLKKLKDSTRRSFRKLDKNLTKYSAKVEILSSQYQNLSESFFNLQHLHYKVVKSNEEKFLTFEKFVNKSENHMSPGQLFNKLHSKLIKNSRNFTNVISSDTEFGSGEIETDYILSHKEERQNKVDTESIDGSGEIPREIPREKPHRHKNYVLIPDFRNELNLRDDEISNLYDIYYILYKQMSRVEDRLSSIHLGKFMEQLQNSLLNFTENVLTLDQWKMTSSGIINSTQFNHHQITTLSNMIVNNTNYLHNLEWKLTNVQSLGYQQFHLLRMHIIRLNNTVQDMKEEINKWHKNGHGTPSQNSQTNPVTTTTKNLDLLTSRVEDLALQIIYNENRIAKLEIQVLNESLLQCKKANTDIYQDSKLMQVQKDVHKLAEGGVLAKNMIRNLDQAFYRLHTTNMNQSEIIATLIKDTQTLGKYLPIIIDIQREIINYKFQLPKDCDEYYRQGHHDDGVYVIYPFNATQSVRVYCDMEARVGGWTVIQRRSDDSLNFDKMWKDYVNGFGSIDGDHWLGNDLIHLLTANKNMSLKIEMIDVKDNFWVGEYKMFKVENQNVKYRLHVNGFHGNCTDGLSYANGMSFSTPDQDNDGSTTHCAMYYTAGWWYKHCHHSNLNGRHNLGMVWYHNGWKDWIELQKSVMKIKPVL